MALLFKYSEHLLQSKPEAARCQGLHLLLCYLLAVLHYLLRLYRYGEILTELTYWKTSGLKIQVPNNATAVPAVLCHQDLYIIEWYLLASLWSAGAKWLVLANELWTEVSYHFWDRPLNCWFETHQRFLFSLLQQAARSPDSSFQLRSPSKDDNDMDSRP